jgi:tetratricopeptide (TPR) repeat protein
MKSNFQNFLENKLSSGGEDDLLRTLDISSMKKEKLRQWRESQKMQVKSSSLFFRKQTIWGAVAACIVLVAGVGYWKFMATTPPQYQDTLAEYRRDIPKLSTVQMGTTETTIMARKNAEMAYSQQNFERAVGHYLQVVASETTAKPADYFYLGVSYAQISTPNYEKAISYFQKVRNLDAAFKKQELAYQLGLCYAATHQFSLARQELLSVKDANGLSEKVQKLIDILPQ